MKLKYILGTLSFVLLSTGCQDFLNKAPENKVPVNDVDYTNTAGAYQPVSGVYSKAAWNLNSWAQLGFKAVRGDDTYKGGSDGDQQIFADIHDFNYSGIPNFWANGNSWMGDFGIVMDANLAMIALDNYQQYAVVESDKALIESYKGELKFLRGYAYFVLARLYGGVPVFTDNRSDDLYFKKSHEEVIRFIISEMSSAANLLPAVHPRNMKHPGAASKYSALALQAKAAAEIADYQTVYTTTEEIINSGLFELYPNFYELFNMSGELCSENLFELQYSYFGQTSGDEAKLSDNYFAFQGPSVGSRFVSKKKFGADNDQNMGGGWGFLPASDKFVKFMESRGETTRLEGSIIRTTGKTDKEGNQYNVTLSGDTLYAGLPGSPIYYSGKAYTPSKELIRNQYGGDKNAIMIRYADILLLNAEARLKLGKGGETVPFNIVRRRANMPEMASITMDDIVNERFAEFALENGERYYDLVRTGYATKELGSQGKGYSESVRFYPIPQEQIDLNPNLKD